jgi:hypothetical protein
VPTLTRWFIKTSFFSLAAGLTLGLLQSLQPVFDLQFPNGLFPVYIHLLVLGWLTQLIFGVVFWMFPKYSSARPRGSDSLGWWTYALLNSGLVLRLIAEPVNSTAPTPLTGWLLVVSAAFQFLAGLTFTSNTWARVKEK